LHLKLQPSIIDSQRRPGLQNPMEEPRQENSTKPATQAAKGESLLLNLLLNIVAPTIILTKLSGDAYLGTTWAIVVALAFPIAYGLRDFYRRRKVNLFSALGVLSVLLTGGISLLGLAPKYLAIKEAAIPGIFGLATILSVNTPYPLVRTLLYNDTVLETEEINRRLDQSNNHAAFERRLVNASWLVAGSFFLSSALNYLLAVTIVTGMPGTVEYNEQLGKMTALSFPVIALPATLVMMAAMFYLFRGISNLTGLQIEDIIRHKH